MEGFYDKYRCGKAVDLRSARQEGTRFAGRRVMQHPDFRITVSMDEYVKSKLRPIEVPKGYVSNTKEISDGMLTNVKGVKWWFGLAGVNNKTSRFPLVKSSSESAKAHASSEAPNELVQTGVDRDDRDRLGKQSQKN